MNIPSRLVVAAGALALATGLIAAPATAAPATKAGDRYRAQNTVASIASFVAAGIANGSLSATPPPAHQEAAKVNGPATLWGSGGRIDVPKGFTARWNTKGAASSFCVSGKIGKSGSWKYTNVTGAVTKGKCGS